VKRRVIAVLAMALALGACAEPDVPKTIVPPTAADPIPALDEDRVSTVLTEVTDCLAAGDAALSTDALAPRVTGLAARARGIQYQLASALADTGQIDELPTTATVTYVTAGSEFPRVAFVVTSPGADGLPRLLVLVQASARTNFELTEYTKLLPGTVLPDMANLESGAAPVLPDAPGLVALLQDVPAMYSDVLNDFDGSGHLGAFADDAFRPQVRSVREALTESLGDHGTFTETSTPIPDSIWAIQTMDEGALVVAAVSTVTTITLDDARITLGPVESTLAGTEDKLSSTLGREWQDTFLFYVPPAETAEPIQLLGADRILIAATGN
jgi:hypothetical protein